MQGRIWYWLHILRDRKYIANPVPRDIANRHIRVATNVTPKSLRNRASQYKVPGPTTSKKSRAKTWPCTILTAPEISSPSSPSPGKRSRRKGRKYKLAQSANIRYGMYSRFVSFAFGARFAGEGAVAPISLAQDVS